jgi:hypothetical protein
MIAPNVIPQVPGLGAGPGSNLDAWLYWLQRNSIPMSRGIDATRRVWTDPTGAEAQLPLAFNREEYYNRLWAYANNEMYGGELWQDYRANFHLYRLTRALYNHTPRLIDFYVRELYPGFLTTRTLGLPESVQIAIPFAEGTDPRLLAAIEQFWTWSNFQTQKDQIVRWTAALGNCLVEVVDDVARRKIWSKAWWPGHITRLLLDQAGNVKFYTLEYQARDPDGSGTFMFRKDVSPEVISYYKNDTLFDFDGNGAEVPNPYGFVPACWFRHANVGEAYGQPAIGRTLGKIDEVNSLASHADDRLHVVMRAPVLVATGGQTGDFDKRGATHPQRFPTGDEEDDFDSAEVNIIEGPQGSTISTVTLDVGSTLNWVKSLLEEIEAELRELSAYDAALKMNITTGPALNLLFGDVAKKVVHVQAGYDEQMRKLFQMVVAIGGLRAEGAWNYDERGARRQLGRRQRLFEGFGLDSYEEGDLDMLILPRELFPITPGDKWTAEKLKWDTIFIASQVGLPRLELFKLAGYSAPEAQRFSDEFDKLEEAKAAQEHTQALELKAAGATRAAPSGAGTAPPGKGARSNRGQAGVRLNNNGNLTGPRAGGASPSPTGAAQPKATSARRRVKIQKASTQ